MQNKGGKKVCTTAVCAPYVSSPAQPLARPGEWDSAARAAGRALTVDRGVFAVVVVPHGGPGHGTAHSGAGLRDGVAAQIHHVLRAPAGTASEGLVRAAGEGLPTPDPLFPPRCAEPNPNRHLFLPREQHPPPRVGPGRDLRTHPSAAPPRSDPAPPPVPPSPAMAAPPRRDPAPCNSARRSAAPAPRAASIAGTAGTAPPQGLPGHVVHSGIGPGSAARGRALPPAGPRRGSTPSPRRGPRPSAPVGAAECSRSPRCCRSGPRKDPGAPARSTLPSPRLCAGGRLGLRAGTVRCNVLSVPRPRWQIPGSTGLPAPGRPRAAALCAHGTARSMAMAAAALLTGKARSDLC